jgi:uncharacterized DUF497 family protein
LHPAWLALDLVYICAYDDPCRSSGIPKKAIENRAKHGVRLADGVVVLEDPLAVTIPDPGSEEEDGFVTIGMDEQGRVLVVAYVWRGDSARVISVRPATRSERRDYEGGV